MERESCLLVKMEETYRRLDEKINRLEKRVKALEQAETHFPMTEDKHRALLNNCVDDDEAILHEREIEGVNINGY